MDSTFTTNSQQFVDDLKLWPRIKLNYGCTILLFLKVINYISSKEHSDGDLGYPIVVGGLIGMLADSIDPTCSVSI